MKKLLPFLISLPAFAACPIDEALMQVNAESCDQESCYQYTFSLPDYEPPLAKFAWQMSFQEKNKGTIHPEALYQKVKALSDQYHQADQMGQRHDFWGKREKLGTFMQVFYCHTHLITNAQGEEMAEPIAEKTYYLLSPKNQPLNLLDYLLPGKQAALNDFLAAQLADFSPEEKEELLSLPPNFYFTAGGIGIRYTSEDLGESILSLPPEMIKKLFVPAVWQAAKNSHNRDESCLVWLEKIKECQNVD